MNSMKITTLAEFIVDAFIFGSVDKDTGLKIDFHTPSKGNYGRGRCEEYEFAVKRNKNVHNLFTVSLKEGRKIIKLSVKANPDELVYDSKILKEVI